MSDDLKYGAVKIIGGTHAGRIGNYDDDDTEYPPDTDWESLPDDAEVAGEEVAIVYFGEFLLSTGYYLLPFDCLAPATTDDLLKRREELRNACDLHAAKGDPEKELDDSTRLDLMCELQFTESELVDRLIQSRYLTTDEPVDIFISHSSKDKAFARSLCVDLRDAGHNPWLDEDKIRVGESIPKKIGDGLTESKFVAVILSEYSVESKWVETEWHSKYWDEGVCALNCVSATS